MSVSDDNSTDERSYKYNSIEELVLSKDFVKLHDLLSDLRDFDCQSYFAAMIETIQLLLKHSNYQMILDLMMAPSAYPFLITTYVTEHMLELTSSGDKESIISMIESLGLPFKGKNSSGLNMFESAIVSGQLELAKFVDENLAVTSREPFLMEAAIKRDRPDMLPYLYELGIAPSEKLIKTAVKSHSIGSLEFLKDIQIVKISDPKVFEYSIQMAVDRECTEILSYLIDNFIFKYDYRSLVTSKRSVYISLMEAVRRRNKEFLLYVSQYLKLRFHAETVYDEGVQFVNLLPISIEKEDFEIFCVLVNELQINPALIGEVCNHSGVYYALQIRSTSKRKKFVRLLLEKEENLDELSIEQIWEVESYKNDKLKNVTYV